MQTVLMLTKRNIKLYMRDRSAVFFSMLTILIIIALNVVFLQKMNVDSLTEMLPVSTEKATSLVNSLTLAGIIFTSTVTVTLTVIGIMIQDEESNRLMGFLTAPISRVQLILGYIFAAFITGCLFALITLLISQAYIAVTGGTLLSIGALLLMVGMIVVNVFASSCMVFFLATFIHSSGSFSALNTILGTLIGFIAGIYLPMGMLPEVVQKVLKFFPGLYGATMLRNVYAAEPLKEVFHLVPATALGDYSRYMGITLTWGSTEVSTLQQLLILLFSGIIFIIFSSLVLSRKKGSDR